MAKTYFKKIRHFKKKDQSHWETLNTVDALVGVSLENKIGPMWKDTFSVGNDINQNKESKKKFGPWLPTIERQLIN